MARGRSVKDYTLKRAVLLGLEESNHSADGNSLIDAGRGCAQQFTLASARGRMRVSMGDSNRRFRWPTVILTQLQVLQLIGKHSEPNLTEQLVELVIPSVLCGKRNKGRRNL